MAAWEKGCPHCGAQSSAFKAMSDAVLAVASERLFDPILDRLVEVAAELVNARYAAIGVPDEEGSFAHFRTVGVTDEEWDAIGPLPRQHGLLGEMLRDPKPFRFPDIRTDPRFEGWPDEHPDMTSFLGVPIVSKDRIVGAFYLTDKIGAAEFGDTDQMLVEMLAAHAAIAIENAQLYERARELSVVEERNRLARELHDAVSQTLFSVNLTAQAALELVDRDPEKAKQQIAHLLELTRHATTEMRSLIFELRPAVLGTDGLVPTLRKHLDILGRVGGRPIDLDVSGERRFRAPAERELFRIAQEALGNAIKHSGAETIDVTVRFGEDEVVLEVRDDGKGFDVEVAQAYAKRLGLTSMQERAASVGGRVNVRSSPREGTLVRASVPYVR